MISGNKRRSFAGIEDKLWNNVMGWKRWLFSAGFLGSLPTCVTSMFKLPLRLEIYHLAPGSSGFDNVVENVQAQGGKTSSGSWRLLVNRKLRCIAACDLKNKY